MWVTWNRWVFCLCLLFYSLYGVDMGNIMLNLTTVNPILQMKKLR